MTSRYLKDIIKVLAIVITPISVSQWLSIPINSTVIRLIQLILCFHIIVYSFKSSIFFNTTYNVIRLYLIWVIIGVIRGVFVSTSFWDYNLLSIGSTCLCLPLFSLYFANPYDCHTFLYKWRKICIPLFFLLIVFICPFGSYHFYLAPFFLWGAFIPILRRKWKIIIFFTIIIMLIVSLEARSQVIKASLALLMSTAYFYRSKLNNFIYKTIHWGIYISTILLIYLGLSGQFNIFKDSITNNNSVNENNKLTQINADTRTSIYLDVINSAINNNYILFGRTPARGNDIYISFSNEDTKNYSNMTFERHINEVCHPNIFTWLGVIGVLLYSLIYIKASWLALYRSNSNALKLLGCFVAFHWMFGWIEDTNIFNISNIILWMIIGICFSDKFRNMNDYEFSNWLNLPFK